MIVPNRYALVCKETWPQWRGDPRAGINLIMKAVNMDPTEFQLGKTKVFVKTPESVLIFLLIIRALANWLQKPQIAHNFLFFSLLLDSCSCWKKWGSASTTITQGSCRKPFAVILRDVSARSSVSKLQVMALGSRPHAVTLFYLHHPHFIYRYCVREERAPKVFLE